MLGENTFAVTVFQLNSQRAHTLIFFAESSLAPQIQISVTDPNSKTRSRKKQKMNKRVSQSYFHFIHFFSPN